jgi:broad specificity phosphatase PhoE
MKLYLTRHTESTYNVLHICNANPAVDVPLTELGGAQAEALAKKLSSVDFGLIITSELPRTKQTADIINQFHRMHTEVDRRLNDIDAYEGKPWDEYDAARSASDNVWTFKAKGDESYQNVEMRARSFLESLKYRSEKSILVVAHQAVIRAILKLLNNLPPEQAFLSEVPQGEYREYEL